MTHLYRISVFIVLYICLRQLAVLLEVAPHVSAFYPAPALAIAFIGTFGIQYLPVYFVAIVLGGQIDMPFWEFSTLKWWMIVRQLAVYGGVGLCIHVFFRRRIPLRSFKDLFVFLAIAFCASLLAALLARVTFESYDIFPSQILNEKFVSFWIGDGSGLILFAPLLFILMDSMRDGKALSRLKRYTLRAIDNLDFGIYTVFFVALVIIFIKLFTQVAYLEYACLVPIVLGSMRMGFLRGYLAVMFINIFMILSVQLIGITSYSVVEVQLYFIVSTVIAMIVGMARDTRQYTA